MSLKIFTKSYEELISLATFDERLNYLRLDGKVGIETFGINRYFNQQFYRSREWKRVRDQVIVRDLGCDLAIPELEICDRVYIHHINPILIEDLEYGTSKLFDLENLICCSYETHNDIHYGVPSRAALVVEERKPFDTCPWRS